MHCLADIFVLAKRAAAAQLGTMRWVTSCVKAPAPTEEAQALKKNLIQRKMGGSIPMQAFISLMF